MRLTELHFHRVGLWSNLPRLDFGPRVTVVLGDNEAGKTTAMRAIEALLFGPTRKLVAPLTSEQLFHASATAELGGAGALSWTWRNRALAPEEAARALRAAFPEETASRFQDLFRIGHAEVKATSAFLSESGALGRVLFAAGSGASAANLQSLEERLEKRLKEAESSAEAKDGLKARLNKCRALKDRLNGAAHFADHDRKTEEVERIQESLTALALELNGLVAERERLDAYARGLEQHATLARARELLLGLEQQGPVAPTSWALRIDAALVRLAAGRGALDEAAGKLAEAQARLKASPAVPEVFRFAQEIERLASGVGGAAKDRGALERHRRELEESRSALAEILQSFGRRPVESELVAAAESFAIPKARRESLKQRLEARRRALATRDAARDQAQRAGAEASRAEEAAGKVAESPVGELEIAKGLTDSLSHAEASLQKLEKEAAQERANAVKLTAELGLGDKSLEAAASLRLPEKDALADASQRLDEAQDAEKDAEKELRKQQQQAEEARSTAARLRASEEAPATAAALERTRAARQQSWEALKATWSPRWRQGAELELPALGGRFELQLLEADGVADRRFGSAERVCALEAAEREAAEAAQAVERARHDWQRGVEARQAAGLAWVALWPFQGPAPKAHQSWLIQHGQLRQHVASLAQKSGEQRSAEESCARLRKDLSSLLARELPAAAGLESAQGLAEAVGKELDRRKQENAGAQKLRATREATREARAKSAHALESAEENLAQWSASWAEEAVPSLPPGVAPEPEVVGQWLEEQERLEQLLGALRKAEQAAGAAAGAVGAFERETRELLARARAADPALALSEGLGAEQAADGLSRLAKEAAKLDEQRRAEESRRGDFEKELEGKKAALATQQESLGRLWSEAGRSGAWTEERCQDESKRAHEAQALREQAGQVEKALAAVWPMGEQQACAEIAGRPAHELAAAAEERAQRIEELQSRRSGLLEQKGARRKECDSLEAPLSAEEGKQALANASGRALEKVEEVVALKTALWLLEKAKERAAESAQPLVDLASEYFAALTGGAYEGLAIDRTGKQPTLLALPASGLEKSPEALSDGTADQIWLALRLAVAREAARQTRFPLLLDDVFVHFDDSRTEAALRLLGELSAELQIVIFTHHDRVVDLARRAIPGELKVVVLARPEASIEERGAEVPVRHERPSAPEAVQPEERPRATGAGLPAATRAVVEALRFAAAPMSKTEILDAARAGAPELEASWNPAIKALKEQGLVVQEGEKRGARYRLAESAPAGAE